MNQTIDPISFEQVITGIDLSQTVILGLIGFCLALAFGAIYGLNLIYDKEKITRFKEYRKVLKNNVIFKLRALTFRPENFEEEFDKFIEEWQTSQSKVMKLYDRILSWRRFIFLVFLFSALAYFNRLLMPNLYLLGYKISLISNLLFLVGLISLIVFGWLFHNLEKNLAKYELERSSPEESIRKIKAKIFKKKK